MTDRRSEQTTELETAAWFRPATPGVGRERQDPPQTERWDPPAAPDVPDRDGRLRAMQQMQPPRQDMPMRTKPHGSLSGRVRYRRTPSAHTVMEWLTVVAILIAIGALLGICLLLAQRTGITSWPHHAKPTPSPTATHHHHHHHRNQ